MAEADRRFDQKYAVSTACFLQDNSKAILQGAITRQPNLEELERTIHVAQQLGVGIEYDYRNHTYAEEIKILQSAIEVPVFQLHGPIPFNLTDAIKQGLQEDDKMTAVKSAVATILVLGSVEDDLVPTLATAKTLGAKQVVLHPHAAQKMGKQRPGMLRHAKELEVGLVVEPDWKRQRQSPYIIYDPQTVVTIADQIGGATLIDTSHTLITTGISPDVDQNELIETYDQLKKARGGVQGVHISAVVPFREEDRRRNRIHGSVPLSPRSIDPKEYAAVYEKFRDFNAHLKAEGYNGPRVIEIFQFDGATTIDQKQKRIEETIYNMDYKPQQEQSISIPSQPTHRPI